MKLYGVAIGIDKYTDRRIIPLQFARHDAEALYNLFQSKIDRRDLEFLLITDKAATREKIMRTIGEKLAGRVTPKDVVLLYFACHGSPESQCNVDNTSRYLITADTKYDSIFATAIDLERDLLRLIQRLRGFLVIVLLDSCFSGRAGGRTFEGPNWARRAKPRGRIKLSKLTLGEGRIVMSACDDNQVALEDVSLGHGVFTYYLVQALTDPKKRGWEIPIVRLYESVYREVVNHTNGTQTPILNGRDRLSRLPILS